MGIFKFNNSFRAHIVDAYDTPDPQYAYTILVDGNLSLFRGAVNGCSDPHQIAGTAYRILQTLMQSLPVKIEKIIVYFDGQSPTRKANTSRKRAINLKFDVQAALAEYKRLLSDSWYVVNQLKVGESEMQMILDRDHTKPTILVTNDSDVYHIAYGKYSTDAAPLYLLLGGSVCNSLNAKRPSTTTMLRGSESGAEAEAVDDTTTTTTTAAADAAGVKLYKAPSSTSDACEPQTQPIKGYAFVNLNKFNVHGMPRTLFSALVTMMGTDYTQTLLTPTMVSAVCKCYVARHQDPVLAESFDNILADSLTKAKHWRTVLYEVCKIIFHAKNKRGVRIYMGSKVMDKRTANRDNPKLTWFENYTVERWVESLAWCSRYYEYGSRVDKYMDNEQSHQYVEPSTQWRLMKGAKSFGVGEITSWRDECVAVGDMSGGLKNVSLDVVDADRGTCTSPSILANYVSPMDSPFNKRFKRGSGETGVV